MLSRSINTLPLYLTVHLREDGDDHVPNTRLPLNSRPKTYDTEMVIKWDPEWTAEGSTTIVADVTTGNSNDGVFAMNADRKVSIDESSIKITADSQAVALDSIWVDFERQFFFIKYQIQSGDFEISVSMNFRTSVRGDFYGLFR